MGQKNNPNNIPLPKRLRENIKTNVAGLYLKGYNYKQILAEIEKVFGRRLSVKTIYSYINALVKEWREERIDKIDDLKTIELNRINKLEQTYWESWEATKEVDGIGDARFLGGVQWCIQKRCKLLGIEAPLNIVGDMPNDMKRNIIFNLKTRNSG